MAYATGSSFSQNDLLQQLAAWLVIQGWTLDASQADGAGWRVHLHKSGIYVHIRVRPANLDPFNGHISWVCKVPTMALYLSSGFEAGTAGYWYNNMNGAPMGTDGKVCGECLVLNEGANFGYHFFHDGNDNYTIVVERNAGLFSALGFGFSLIKHGGAWTGGQYIWGHFTGGGVNDYPANQSSYAPFIYGAMEAITSNAGLVRADVNSFADQWICIGPNTSSARGNWTGKRGYSTHEGKGTLPTTIPYTKDLDNYTVSAVNNQAVLLPIRIYVDLDEEGPALLGTVPSHYRTKAVGSGYLATDLVQYGADTYMLFPNFAVKKV